jgi:pimeloyl-ACP methyl ester carboxylesterase
VLGHSLTAHGMLAMLGQHPEVNDRIDALVSVSSNVWIPDIEPSRARQIRKWMVLAAFGAVTWPIGYFPAKRLGAGSEDVSRSFVETFQSLRKSAKWRSTDGKTDYIAALDRVRVPVLAVVGRGDTLLCHPDCSARYHRLLTDARVWHWTVGKSTGLNFDPDHMQVLTDERASGVWRGIGRWLEERFKKRGERLDPGFEEIGRIP